MGNGYFGGGEGERGEGFQKAQKQKAHARGVEFCRWVLLDLLWLFPRVHNQRRQGPRMHRYQTLYQSSLGSH